MSIYDIPEVYPRFPEYYNLESPLIILEKPVFTKEEVISMINKKGEAKLFCYKCNTHVKPIMKHGESILYFDIEALPIIDRLSYCPICNEEVYDPDYELLVIMYKVLLINKRERLDEL